MNNPALTDAPGGTDIEFQDEHLVIDPAGALYWPDRKLLAVSDLHLEKGSSFASRRGMMIPPYDTRDTLRQLSLLVHKWQPEALVSLGDSFHDEEASSRLALPDRQTLKTIMKGREWIWICGNHDPSPPKGLGGTFCNTLHLGKLNFRHEPEAVFEPGEIAGHLHPCAKIRMHGKSVRRRCIVGDKSRLILPAIGAYAGGLNIRHEAFCGLLAQESLTAWMLSRGCVFEVSGKRLIA